jgi:uncharacterized protein YcaQ
VRRLSLAQAQRVALAAQGLTEPRPRGRVDRRHVRRLFDTIGVLQLDSVNVVARAHQLTMWSRLGHHDRTMLDRVAYATRPPEVFESWVHEASLVPVELHPLLRWRMDRARGGDTWGRLARFATSHPDLVEQLWEEVAERGPLAAADLSEPGRSRGPWWGWNDTKIGLEYLFRAGRLVALRRNGFERVYEIPERHLPETVLGAPTPDVEEAQRELLRRAARHLGVATVGDLADYHRMRNPDARPRVAELVGAGELEEVRVEGWREPALLWPRARRARRPSITTLVSPFDPIMWRRERVERLFGFHYRIEIYVPAAKRRWGYYVLPFLHEGRFRARVDLKADRGGRRLLVQAAWLEPGENAAVVAEALGAELEAFAAWLDLEAVDVARRGDLAPVLARVLGP